MPTGLDTISSVNIALEGYSIVISLLILLSLFRDNMMAGKKGKFFFGIVSVNILVLLSDLLTWVFSGRSDLIPFLYACNFLVYSLGYIMMALFTYFVVLWMFTNKKTLKIIGYIILVVTTAAVSLVFVSLFNHMYFSFTAEGEYQRGNLYMISQVYPILVLGVDLVLILVKRKSLDKSVFYSLMSYEIFPIAAMIIQIFVYGITLLYLGTTIAILVIYLTMRIQLAVKMKENELSVQKANVSVMLSQIQPHFLYNSLATIKELVEINPKEAEQAIDSFSDFLRGNMASLSMDAPIPFEDELAHTKDYLSLEKLRFGDRVNVVYDLKANDFKIPTLSLQPLVENAIRHGITKKVEGGTITISTYEDSSNHYLRIKDDGVGFDPSAKVADDGRKHVGLTNVKMRLKDMCEASIKLESQVGVGTDVVITLPKEEKKDAHIRG